jgi:competence protein ComFC
VNKPICKICGTTIKSQDLCSRCRKDRPNFNSLRSWEVFEVPEQKAIHGIKYRRDISLGFELANLMTTFIAELKWPIDIVVPVPLGRKRKSERGYNQVSLIAYPLALRFGWKYLPNGLIRIRETGSQVGLNASDRQINVLDAFAAIPQRVEGRKVLLIDDVATTGATLSSCTDALKVAGATDVFAVTFARARTNYGLPSI